MCSFNLKDLLAYVAQLVAEGTWEEILLILQVCLPSTDILENKALSHVHGTQASQSGRDFTGTLFWLGEAAKAVLSSTKDWAGRRLRHAASMFKNEERITGLLEGGLTTWHWAAEPTEVDP